MTAFADKLATIRVLFRAPDTLALYGIPYEMRPGQQPGDLWRVQRDWSRPDYRQYPDLSDWIWLGGCGWWGHLSDQEITAIKPFLARHGDLVPQNPYEWCELPR